MVSPVVTTVDTVAYPTPAGCLASLPTLLGRVARQYDREGVLLLTRETAEQLGLPVTAGGLENHPEPIDLHGWKARRIADWTTFTHKREPTIIVGILPLIDPGQCPFVATPWPTDVTAAFKGWHDLTGKAWHHTAGIAGISVLRDTLPTGRQTPTSKPEPVEGAVERPYYPEDWRGTPAELEILWDKTRAYIGAASTVRVAPYALREGPKRFDRTRAGWWYVELGPWNESRLPNPAGYGDPGPRWVTTPTLALLEDLHEAGDGPAVDFTVIKSRVSTGSGRELLKPWAARMRDAYDGAALLADPGDRDRVRRAVKDAGRAALGMLAASGSWLYRPDWWAAVVAQSRCNMFRAMANAAETGNRWPVEVKVDGVWYAKVADDPIADAPPGFTIGDKLGAWKRKGERRMKASV